jgi:hypothetical protein
MKYKKIRLALRRSDQIAFFGALYLFLSMQPFFIWSLEIVSLVYLIPFVALFFPVAHESGFRFSFNKAVLFTITFIYTIYIAIPLLGRDQLFGKLILFSPFFLLLFVSADSLQNIFLVWKKILIFFVLYALTVYILFAFEVDIPHWTIHNSDKIPLTSRDMHFFRVYGLVVSSTNSLWRIGDILTMRLCGPFAEPGHLGIYIGFTMLIDRFFLNKTNKILLIGGFLTLSPAFLLILIVIEIYRIIIEKRINWKLYITILLIFIGISIIKGPEIKDRIIYITVERHSDLDQRSPKEVRYRFAQFIRTPQVLTGIGTDEFEKFGGSLSDPRGMLAKFGLIGTILSFSLILMLLAVVEKKDAIFLLAAVLIVYSHRVWMFETVYIYMFMLIASAAKMKTTGRQTVLE